MAKSKSTASTETPEQAAAREAEFALGQVTEKIARYDLVFDSARILEHAFAEQFRACKALLREADVMLERCERGLATRYRYARLGVDTIGQTAEEVHRLTKQIEENARVGLEALNGARKAGAKLAPMQVLELLVGDLGESHWVPVAAVPMHFHDMGNLTMPLAHWHDAWGARLVPTEPS